MVASPIDGATPYQPAALTQTSRHGRSPRGGNRPASWSMPPATLAGAVAPFGLLRAAMSLGWSMRQSGPWGSPPLVRTRIRFRRCQPGWPCGTRPRRSWPWGAQAWAVSSKRTAHSGRVSGRLANLGPRNFRVLPFPAMAMARRASRHHRAMCSGWVPPSTAPCPNGRARSTRSWWVRHGSSGPWNPLHRFLRATANLRGPPPHPGCVGAQASPRMCSIFRVQSMTTPTDSAVTSLRPMGPSRHGARTSGEPSHERVSRRCINSRASTAHEPTCSSAPMPCGRRVTRVNWCCI